MMVPMGVVALVFGVFALAAHSTSVVGTLVALALGWELADLASGLFHWAVDNFGNRRTLAFGEIIDDFQGHHLSPGDIVAKVFVEVTHPGARFLAPPLAVVALLGISGVIGASLTAVMLAFLGAAFLGQVFHRWSHVMRAPWPVAAVQRAGLLLSKRAHSAHHDGHASHYAIITGHTNPLLDRILLPRLERLVRAFTGKAPRVSCKAYLATTKRAW
jgi:ubiquitin-conjugating enzyme E2 variant